MPFDPSTATGEEVADEVNANIAAWQATQQFDANVIELLADYTNIEGDALEVATTALAALLGIRLFNQLDAGAEQLFRDFEAVLQEVLDTNPGDVGLTLVASWVVDDESVSSNTIVDVVGGNDLDISFTEGNDPLAVTDGGKDFAYIGAAAAAVAAEAIPLTTMTLHMVGNFYADFESGWSPSFAFLKDGSPQRFLTHQNQTNGTTFYAITDGTHTGMGSESAFTPDAHQHDLALVVRADGWDLYADGVLLDSGNEVFDAVTDGLPQYSHGGATEGLIGVINLYSGAATEADILAARTALINAGYNLAANP